MNNKQHALNLYISTFDGDGYKRMERVTKYINEGLGTNHQPEKLYRWLKGTRPIPATVIIHARHGRPWPCDRCEKYVKPENDKCPHCGLEVVK